MKLLKTFLAAAALVTLATGCSTTSPDVISRNDAQRMSSLVDATVLSTRPVTVEGTQSGVGGVAGGVVGGIAGSSVGGRREAVAVGVLAAVVGSVVGNVAERAATREGAVEILLQLRNGDRRAVVQATGGENFQPGQAVILVTTGSKVRVVAAPPGGQQAPARAPG